MKLAFQKLTKITDKKSKLLTKFIIITEIFKTG